ncbi:KpsF/GutQ family sugar-phosphate isomerase [soil metagenome]
MLAMADENQQKWAEDAAIARDVLEAESCALKALKDALDPSALGRALDLIMACPSQIVVTGMGKSGHIAAKIAATLASTGTPAFFLHPGEALHGDLGMITAANVVIAFSQSGATDEIVNLLPYISRLRAPLIAITGNADSPLAKYAEVILLSRVEQEACPLNLAPTTSTTAQLALGDAVAMALMKRRGFTPDDFAVRHPLGVLGKRLLIHVSDLMHSGDEVPVIEESAPLRAAITRMTGKRLGAVNMIDAHGKLSGIFCDGDLRRLFDKLDGHVDVQRPVSDVMIRNPKHCHPDMLGVKAVDMMETYKITVLPVVDRDGRPVGMIHLHDLIRAGISP